MNVRHQTKPSLRPVAQAVVDALSPSDVLSLADLLLGRKLPRLRVLNGGKP